MLNTEQYKEIIRLCMLTKEYLCFEFDGLLIKGNVANVMKQYVIENPSKKLRTWLIDNDYVVKEL